MSARLRRELMAEMRELLELDNAVRRLVNPSKGLLDMIERRRRDVERHLLEMDRPGREE